MYQLIENFNPQEKTDVEYCVKLAGISNYKFGDAFADFAPVPHMQGLYFDYHECLYHPEQIERYKIIRDELRHAIFQKYQSCGFPILPKHAKQLYTKMPIETVKQLCSEGERDV